MGQATVSPDPLDESTTTTSIASADDLLAQLAGEEIDRLLAESEAERAATGADRAEPAAAPAFATSPAPERADPLIQQVIPADTATSSAAPRPALAPQMPTPPEPAGPVPGIVGEVAAPAENIDLAFDATAAAERAALNEAPPVRPPGAHVEPELAVEEPQPLPLPLFLRPLEWLNAPLASCPEGLRESLGKVAIVTLVNAVAVLAYVLMFRRQ